MSHPSEEGMTKSSRPIAILKVLKTINHVNQSLHSPLTTMTALFQYKLQVSNSSIFSVICN